MDAGAIVAIAMGGVTILGLVVGFVERRFTRLSTKIDILEKANDDKDVTIADLRSQRDELRVTGLILDRFLNGLPPPKRKGD
jgi:hypothetical protein